MWDWDTVVEKIGGTKLARRWRAHEFRQEVHRAGIAQERRARSANVSGRNSNGQATVTRDRSMSPPRPILPNATVLPQPLQDAGREDDVIFAIPPGGVRPRPVLANTFRHPIYYESPVSSTTGNDAQKAPNMDSENTKDGVNSPVHESDHTDQSKDNRRVRDESSGWTEDPGRFRHAVVASPERTKARLEQESQAPGAFNFFGTPGTKLGPHSLEKRHAERRKSAESEGTASANSSFPTPTTASAASRLAWKFRTESSTTVSSDGCVVQRGFSLAQSASNTGSPTATNEDVSTTRRAKRARPQPFRRITWDASSTTGGFDDGELAHTTCNAPSGKMSTENLDHITAPIRQDNGDTGQPARGGKHHMTSKSEQIHLDPKHTTAKVKHVTRKPGRQLRIVAAEEAGSAIQSDDESDGRDTIVEEACSAPQSSPKPSRRQTPSAKGILKKSSPERSFSADSNASTLTAGMENMKLQDKARAAGKGHQTAAQQRASKPTGAKKQVQTSVRGGSARRGRRT